jgi:hypothetical protein
MNMDYAAALAELKADADLEHSDEAESQDLANTLKSSHSKKQPVHRAPELVTDDLEEAKN